MSTVVVLGSWATAEQCSDLLVDFYQTVLTDNIGFETLKIKLFY